MKDSDNTVDAAETKADAPRPVKSYRWPVAVMVLGLMVLAAYTMTLHMGRETLSFTRDTAAEIFKGAADVARQFSRGRITETFISHLPEISSTDGGNLELAVLQCMETMRRENIKTVAWDYILLGRTVAEIRVPVTYRYHLRLADRWQLDVDEGICIVKAPRIRPTLPPAIATDQMIKESRRGWLRFDTAEQMQALEREITPRLRLHARDPRRLELVREECRKTVARFVRQWLMRENQWGPDRFVAIKVIFPDESADETASPTLLLDPLVSERGRDLSPRG